MSATPIGDGDVKTRSDAFIRRRTGAASSPSPLPALRDGLRIVWSMSDGFTRRRLLLVAVLIAAGAALSALAPVALKLAVDRLSVTGGGDQYPGPVVLIVLYVAGQFLTRCLSEIRMAAHGQAQGRVYRNIGLRLFSHLLRLPMRFHLERKTGAMGQLGEQGVDGCEQLLHNTIFTILPVAVEFVAIALILLHFDYPVYLAILLAAAVAYVFVFEKGAKGAQAPAWAISNARVEAHAAMTDNLLNAEAIKYYDAEDVVGRRYDVYLAKVEAAWREFSRQRAINGFWTATVFGVLLSTALIYAVHDVLRGSITVGDFVLINSYIVRFVQPLELFGLALREIARALANLQGLFAVLDEPTERDTPTAQAGANIHRGELVFENVSFAYRPERTVLRNVSLHLPAGRTVAVVGVSGSGKSSMIRLLFRLYEPDAGRILLDGVPISELRLSTLRQAIAVVPQDTVLFHDTIGNNIAFGKCGATATEVEEAARIANLHDFICRQPDGYETLVGERGLKLSGGERQRVAIARAALKRPRIFVFDEATSSLDSKTEREILRNLHEVSRWSTTLVIAHRLSTVVHADEIVVLHEGQVQERGSHAELLSRGVHYAALWQAQQSVRSQEPGLHLSGS